MIFSDNIIASFSLFRSPTSTVVSCLVDIILREWDCYKMEINIFVCHHPLPSLFIICMKIMIILVRVVVVVVPGEITMLYKWATAAFLKAMSGLETSRKWRAVANVHIIYKSNWHQKNAIVNVTVLLHSL